MDFNDSENSDTSIDYHFVKSPNTEQTQFLHKQTNENFKFTTQKDYEALTEYIVKYIWQQLEKLGLHKIEKENATFFTSFTTESAKKDLCVLIFCGSGVVRSGQWARKICINDDLETGSAIPDVEYFLSKGYDVVIADPNTDYADHNDFLLSHLELWQNIGILAFSAGGLGAFYIHERREGVRFIALCDAVLVGREPKNYQKISKYWACSKKELDFPLSSDAGNWMEKVSAGTNKHDLVVAMSRPSVYKFIEEKVKENDQ